MGCEFLPDQPVTRWLEWPSLKLQLLFARLQYDSYLHNCDIDAFFLSKDEPFLEIVPFLWYIRVRDSVLALFPTHSLSENEPFLEVVPALWYIRLEILFWLCFQYIPSWSEEKKNVKGWEGKMRMLLVNKIMESGILDRCWRSRSIEKMKEKE